MKYISEYTHRCMGKPLMIQKQDDDKIEQLKAQLGAQTKIEVVRAGLRLLEKETLRNMRIQQWKKAARLVAAQSAEINSEFQSSSLLKK
mgnify:FL=1